MFFLAECICIFTTWQAIPFKGKFYYNVTFGARSTWRRIAHASMWLASRYHVAKNLTILPWLKLVRCMHRGILHVRLTLIRRTYACVRGKAKYKNKILFVIVPAKETALERVMASKGFIKGILGHKWKSRLIVILFR